MRELLSDSSYTTRQSKLFLVAVHCSHPADICFCASTGDRPRVTHGYDLTLGELDDEFLVDARTAHGLDLLTKLPLCPATDQQIDSLDRQTRHAADVQTRIRDTLSRSYAVNAEISSTRASTGTAHSATNAER